MLSTKNLNSNIRLSLRIASKELSEFCSMKIGLQQYYKLLRKMEIISQNNGLSPPYGNGKFFWIEHKTLHGTYGDLIKKMHAKVYTNKKGIEHLLC